MNETRTLYSLPVMGKIRWPRDTETTAESNRGIILAMWAFYFVALGYIGILSYLTQSGFNPPQINPVSATTKLAGILALAFVLAKVTTFGISFLPSEKEKRAKEKEAEAKDSRMRQALQDLRDDLAHRWYPVRDMRLTPYRQHERYLISGIVQLDGPHYEVPLQLDAYSGYMDARHGILPNEHRTPKWVQFPHLEIGRNTQATLYGYTVEINAEQGMNARYT